MLIVYNLLLDFLNEFEQNIYTVNILFLDYSLILREKRNF